MSQDFPVMLPYREALDHVLAMPLLLRTERVPLLLSGDRVLATAPDAPWDQPRFDNSSMDGFAVRCAELAGASEDNPVSLPLAGESAAGIPMEAPLPPGHVARISTGALIPDGADSVAPVEWTSIDGSCVAFRRAPQPGMYIRSRGEDVPAGTPLLSRGTRLDPAALAFLAMYNLDDIEAFARPRIAILTSGEEIKPLGASLRETDIVGVNLYYLAEEMRAFGCEPRLFGISPDDPAKFRALFEQALAWGDIVVTTAGVSMGEHDVVGGVVRDLGAEMIFWKASVRPGKPMLVARIGDKPYFGLPGNPVAVCCNTEIFLKPFLRQAMGLSPIETPRETMRLAAECERDPNRLFFVFATARVCDGEWLATPLPHQSSGNLHNPARANVLLVAEPGSGSIPAGETVNATRIVTGR